MTHALTTGVIVPFPKALARRTRVCVGGPFDAETHDMHVEASRTSTIRAKGQYGFYRVTKTTLEWVDIQH